VGSASPITIAIAYPRYDWPEFSTLGLQFLVGFVVRVETYASGVGVQREQQKSDREQGEAVQRDEDSLAVGVVYRVGDQPRWKGQERDHEQQQQVDAQ
jgi:hypothetical protein